jgi:hypothetical protein
MTLAMTTLAGERSCPGLMIPAAELRAWLARAEPGQRLEYHRGHLNRDRSPNSEWSKPARRKLAAVANLALALAEQGRVHLLQQRHRDGDYSYCAVARVSVRCGQA